jgi:hypothetical protein
MMISGGNPENPPPIPLHPPRILSEVTGTNYFSEKKAVSKSMNY